MGNLSKKDKKSSPLFDKERSNDGNRKKKLKPIPKQKYKRWDDDEDEDDDSFYKLKEEDNLDDENE